MTRKKNKITAQGREGLRALAEKAGVPLDRILELAENDELRSLFTSGRLACRNAGTTAWELRKKLIDRRRPAPGLD